MSFADLGLSPDTLRALEDVGYTQPTPIQSMAIPLVMRHRDMLGIAQTGTGKTASFVLPMIEILSSGRAKARMPRSLILAPTRELASQVADNAVLYSKYHKLSMALLIGGESMIDQQKILDKGVDILIATPGRLIDLFERGAILLRDVKMLVIDEADRMLDMGFIPDVERIVSLLPKSRQTLFFSATMNKEIRRLADAFLSHPEEIRVEPMRKAAELVEQALVVVPGNDKREALRHLLRREAVTNAFIFSNRKRDVDVLQRSLLKHGFDVIALHGDMPQYVRTERLEKFKNGEVSLLVCSDVAARGIDISDVSHVFNFDVPIHAEDYIHRIGRTGRAGQRGAAFMIATKSDQKYLAAIEDLLGNPIPRVTLEGLDTVDLTGDAATGDDSADARSRAPGGRGRKGSPREQRSDDRKSEPAGAGKEERRTSHDPANGGRNGNGLRGGSKGGRWRDGPQSEVMDMPVDDDAIGFGGFTPAFILEAVVVPFLDPDQDDVDDEIEVEDCVGSQPEKAARKSTEKSTDAGEGKSSPSRRKSNSSRRRSRRSGGGATEAGAKVVDASEEGAVSQADEPAPTESGPAVPGDLVAPEAAPEPEAVGESEGVADPQEKPKSRRAAPRRKKAADETLAEEAENAGADPSAVTSLEETAPKKRVSRARKKAADDESVPEGEKKPRKPASPRRKKAVAEAEGAPSAPDPLPSDGEAS